MVYIAPFAMVIVAVQLFNFDPEPRGCRARLRRQAVGGLPLRHHPAAVAGHLLRGDLLVPAELGQLLPDLFSLAGSTRTLPTFVFSGIATGSSPLYPAMATVIFIPGIVLVMVADALRRRAARRLA